MAGNSNFTRLLTTTLANHGREIFDNISTNNALSWLLKRAGNIKVVNGGSTFTHPLVYGTNPSFASIDKNGTISLDEPDITTRAEYPIKVLAGSVSVNKIEVAMNQGNKEKLLDLIQTAKLEAEISMSELLGDQVWADGTTAADFDGLQHLINSSPSTQTDVGGIDPSGEAQWQNQVDTNTVTAFNTSSEGITAMQNMHTNCTFGRLGPTAIFTTKTIYDLYYVGQTSNVRYMDADMADAGFKALQFAATPVFFDDNCPANGMYFVDTNSLWLQVLSGANNQITDFQDSENQLRISALMYIAGNLTTGSRRTNGVITTITG